MEISLLDVDEVQSDVSIAGDVSQQFVHPGQTGQFEELGGSVIYQSQFLVDLAETTYVDSSGIGWFIALHHRINRAGGQLLLHSASPTTSRILSMVGLHSLISIHRTRDEALAATTSS